MGVAVALLALAASPLQAQAPLPLIAENDGFKVQLLELKWIKARNWGMVAPAPAGPGCDLSFRAKLEADGVPAGNYEDEIQLVDEAGQELAVGSRNVKEGIVSGSFRNFDPRLKKAYIVWENKRPGAPPDATGKTNETVIFPAIEIPAPATTLTSNLTQVTKRGSLVSIKSIEGNWGRRQIEPGVLAAQRHHRFLPGPQFARRQGCR